MSSELKERFKMSSESKETVAAAFRKLFRSSDKISESDGSGGSRKNGQEKGNGSPARRLLGRHSYHTDMVAPADSLDNASGPTGGLFKKKNSGSTSSVECPSQKMTVRSRRLMKELRNIQRNERKDPVFTVELINDNLFEWHIRLFRIDSESELATDMRELGITCINLHLMFPDNFPFTPPFMRVISPRIEKGFVMEGGAICMELLTPRGWTSAYTVEAIVMQFAASVVKGQVKFKSLSFLLFFKLFNPIEIQKKY